MRFALLLSALAVAAAAGPAVAQTPPPIHHHTALEHPAKPMTLSNPGASNAQHPMTGQGCTGPHINAAQVANNPTTGRPNAAPIIQIPLGGGGGGVAGATSRAQNAHACAQSRAH